MKQQCVRFVIVVTAIMSLVAVAHGATDSERVVLTLSGGCRAVCIIAGRGHVGVTVTKGNATIRRYSLNTTTQPIILRPVTLRGRCGQIKRALFVQCSGGSCSHDYIFEITSRAGRVLLCDLDKGGVDFGYDSEGCLRGMRFHYWRWHVDAVSPLRKHVYTALDYTWLPQSQRFRHGGVHPDMEAEAKAGLLEILQNVTSDYEYPVSYRSNAAHEPIAYYYQPVGLLKSKTPPELRGARRVEVEVRYAGRPAPYGSEAHIVSIRRAE